MSASTPSAVHPGLSRALHDYRPLAHREYSIDFDRKVDGFAFTGRLSIHPETPDTRTEPGDPLVIDLIELRFDGFEPDVLDVVSPAVVHEIEMWACKEWRAGRLRLEGGAR